VLPVSRRVVFLSKLLALALFAALFIAAAHLAMLPLFVRLSMSRWAEHTFARRLMAHAVASLSASVFVVMAVIAINGLLLVLVPRTRLQAASTAFRSLMLCVLVLAVPLAMRLPAIGPLVAAKSWLLYLAPPIWFLGVQQLLLGQASPYFLRFAAIAAVALTSSIAMAIASYSFLYRRFDAVMLRPATAARGEQRRRVRLLGTAHRRSASRAAISAFTHITLRRSTLHQGVFVAIAACGAGLVLNSFVGAEAVPRLRTYEQALVSTAIWSPFALMFVATLAVRAALVVPIEPRANWVFRMTEDDGSRVEQLNAVVDSVIRLGVIAPLVMLAPVEWSMLKTDAFVCTPIAFLAGIVLVELEMSDWRRVPFTCSYMPGKRFVGLTALIWLATFVVFTSVGSGLVYYSLGHRIRLLVVSATLATFAWQRRRRRTQLTRHTPLLFEDTLPSDVEPLRLASY
jgi:hypothetical protein